MVLAPLPANEPERLRALRGLAVLDTPPEESFDDAAKLASMVCGTPAALVTLLDANRQWFKARVGVEATETPRELAFCGYALLGSEPFIIPDTLADPRFVDHPLVVGEPFVRFYAGAPLVTADGFSLGTICVLDRVPRELDEIQIATLKLLARQVVSRMELRHDVERMKRSFVETINHELRTPLTSIHGAVGLLAAGAAGQMSNEARVMLDVAERNSVRLLGLINDILDYASLDHEPRLISLDEMVRSAASTAGVHFDAAADPSMVNSDPRNLTRAMVNLLTFARANADDVRLTVDGAEVSIEAIGLRVDTRGSDLFDVMQESGVGLSLAIARAIIQKHGAYIDVRRTEGSTFFTFRLAVVRASA